MRFSTSYDSKDNNRRTQTCQDVLQLVKFSTSYDPKENNRSIKGRQEKERQVKNASTRGERVN
jgi:hypothetical protein